MKRGGWLRRFTRLRSRGRPRFKDRADAAYRDYVRSLPCLVRVPLMSCHAGPIEAAHVQTRGAGGQDRGNLVPLCMYHHQVQHAMGIQSFQARFGLDLQREAERVEDEAIWS